jgi:membrane-associated protease RseP (regulator of RpoE activity)
MSGQPPDAAPSPEGLGRVFDVYEVRRNDDRVLYFGDPLVDREELMRAIWPEFRDAGYEVSLSRRTGEFVLVAEPRSVGTDGVPWTNVALAVATVFSTLFAGASWYYVQDPFSPAILEAVPFTLAVMGVLGTHELGHYAMSRYHRVDATLPYFIPIPTLIGTMGAVIKMKGQIPDREALFDIGVAGPLAGLVATIVVTAVGFTLPPVEVPAWVLASEGLISVQFGYPPLLRVIAVAVGEQGVLYQDPVAVLTFQEGIGYESERLAMNPVVIGGWVGMFVTFLNLLPVGQLDGGHILRAIAGPAQERIAAFLPLGLFGLAGYLYFVADAGSAVSIWLFWGVLAGVFAFMGSAKPISDDDLDRTRVIIGVVTFVLGALCFTPVPIEVAAA